MAAKISKLKKFETDNAKNEVRILKELGDMTMRSIDGYQSIIHMHDSLIHNNHVVIVFDKFGPNLSDYIKQKTSNQNSFEAIEGIRRRKIMR